jgi:hypothetical protein
MQCNQKIHLNKHQFYVDFLRKYDNFTFNELIAIYEHPSDLLPFT